MSTIAYTVIGFFVGAGLVLVFSRSARLSAKQAGEKVIGICEVAFGRSGKKRENKEKILELLKEKGEMGNSEIREVLGVSRNTVVHYMDELEKDGKIEQIGVAGQSVTYRLAPPQKPAMAARGR
ncbi:MAG: winged helix-turn-helix transcriptional regulator [Parcubacteria group bacterium]|nr:winged helix-turn-helix transcriptional regulator [Parcubacteria group bacterium]